MVEECIEDHLREFDVYDQTVDIVSCWESFLKNSYSGIFNDFHFERFPSLPQSDGDPLTPDFTVYFNDQYGIIGEIKRTFPDDEVPFRRTLSQIEQYDQDLGIRTDSNSREEPEICDILLVISGSAAPQIGMRITDLMEHDPQFNFTKNLVLMRFHYNSGATLSRYEFQRVTEVDNGFRDDSLPDDISLSGSVGEEGRYGTMEVYPKHFTPLKVKKPICNDEPPGSYLATVLWNKILPHHLDTDEYRRWQQGTVQKTIEIEITLGELTDDLNDYIHDGNVNRQWVRNAVTFLCDAQLGEWDSGDAIVKYRDLVDNIRTRDFQEGRQGLEQPKELAHQFIERYCKYTENGDLEDEEEETQGAREQSGLADFI